MGTLKYFPASPSYPIVLSGSNLFYAISYAYCRLNGDDCCKML